MRLPGLQFWHSHFDLSSGPCLGEESLFRRRSKMTSALGSAFRTGMPTQFWGTSGTSRREHGSFFMWESHEERNHAAYYHKFGWYSNHLHMESLLLNLPHYCGSIPQNDLRAAVTQTISHERKNTSRSNHLVSCTFITFIDQLYPHILPSGYD